jgi:hypothetical protein
LSFGELVGLDMVHVLVVDVTTIEVLVVEHITLK